MSHGYSKYDDVGPLFYLTAEEPPEPPLYPHLVHKPGTFLQELYRKACKEYGVVQYTKFYKGLTSDKIVMRRQRLSPLDVKSCAIALMVIAVSLYTPKS